jgi:hypothetical protein
MFNRVKYFITKNFKKPSTKERLIKIKNKVYPKPPSSSFIIIRKYHTSNTNFNDKNNNKPPNYNMIIISTIALGLYSGIKKIYKDL